MFYLYILLFIFSTLLIAFSVLWFNKSQIVEWKAIKGKEIPGPSATPFLGNLMEIGKNPDIYLLVLQEWLQQYGHTIRFQILSNRNLVFVNSPEGVKHLLDTGFKAGIYKKSQAAFDQYDEFLGRGIFSSNDEDWKFHRSTAKSLFHITNLQKHANIFQQKSNKLIEVLRNKTDTGVDVQDYFMRYTLDSFCQIGFGVDVNSIGTTTNKFAVAFDYVQTHTERRGRYAGLWKIKEAVLPDKEFVEHIKYMNQYTYGIIDSRKNDTVESLEQKPDLLSNLILILRNKNPGMEIKDVITSQKTRKELRDFVMNFLIAGRDTTATMLTWAVYLLAQHPEVERKALEEINKVLGDGPIDFVNQKDLKYVKKILQETLRLYSPVPVDGFDSTRPDILPGGYGVPANTPVLYSAYCLHRRADLWPEPDKFKPERFDVPPVPYSYVPFHGGPRICLGQKMALVEGKIMLAQFLRSFQFQLHKGHIVTPKQAIILTSKYGVKVDLKERARAS